MKVFARRSLAASDVFDLDVPGKGPHPFVVIYVQPTGYLLAGGTSTPQEEPAFASISGYAADQMGLDGSKMTLFHGSLVYVWNEPPPQTVFVKGTCMPSLWRRLRFMANAAIDAHVAKAAQLRVLPVGTCIPLDIAAFIRR